MHKVITECYRVWGSSRKRGRAANIPLEDRRTKESVKWCHVSRKFFGENLTPLRRWLRSQVGRPWNKVYSEACQVIKPDSVVRNHIKVHLLEMVQRRTFLEGGKVWCFKENSWGSVEVPVENACSRYAPFYAHPKTGILKEAKTKTRRNFYAERILQREQYRNVSLKWLSEKVLLRQIDGIWYECRMKPWEWYGELENFDLNYKRVIAESEAEKSYGRAVVCIAKRQLSRKELENFNLKNG